MRTTPSGAFARILPFSSAREHSKAVVVQRISIGEDMVGILELFVAMSRCPTVSRTVGTSLLGFLYLVRAFHPKLIVLIKCSFAMIT